MKKILGSLIAAATIWAGTTAYIGSQTEGNLQEQVNNINKLYANKGIQYKLNNYEKSFLNSKVSIEVVVTDPNVQAIVKDTIKLPLVMDYNIEHGPIFFQNGLGMGAAKVHQEIMLSSLLSDESKEEFLSLIKDDIHIKSDMIISFTNNANYQVTSDAVKIDQEGKSFTMTPLHGDGEMNLETFSGKSNINVASLEFKESGSQNGLSIKNLLFNVDVDEFIGDSIMVGAVNISMDNLSIKDDSNPKMEKISLQPSIKILTKKDSEKTISTMIEGSVELGETKLPDELPPLKTVHASMHMDAMGIEGLMEFQQATQEMQESQAKLLSKMQSSSGDNKEMQKIFEEFGTLQETMMSKMIHSLNTLLVKDQTRIGYSFDIETKEKKQSDAKLEVQYTGDMKFEGSLEEIAMRVQQQALNMANLDVKIVLDAEHIKTLPNAEMLAQQIQMGVAQGFVKKENGKYILNGYYKNRELMVNDNNLTATVLPLLMMATQGGGF